MQALTLLQKFFSVDMVIYAAIVLVAATALALDISGTFQLPHRRPDGVNAFPVDKGQAL